MQNSENFAREASSADALGLTARADPIISVLGTKQVANAPVAGFAVNLTPPQLVPGRTTSIQKCGASVRGRTITQHGARGVVVKRSLRENQRQHESGSDACPNGLMSAHWHYRHVDCCRRDIAGPSCVFGSGIASLAEELIAADLTAE